MAVFIPTQNSQLFSVYHPVDADQAPRRPVLICSPWGWDEVASYRPRRKWAQQLSAAGHPVLRFDLPASGDSSGSPRDRSLVASWLEAIRVAASWLAGRGGDGVAILGLGLGGLLALGALESGAKAAELIILAAPSSGSAFVRQVRNFARLQTWNEAASSLELPAGWIEASGFLLSAETIAELQLLEPAGEVDPGLRRALVLGRRETRSADPLAATLAAAGVDVATDGATGWAAMVSHPERSRLAADAAAKVAAWLAAEPSAAPAPARAGLAAPSAVRATVVPGAGAAAVTEATFAVEQPFGRSFGILATPAAGETADVCLVYLNAGAVRNTGPNRMWVEHGRAWAAAGVPTLRVDLEAIGDAGGDPDGIPPGDAFFASKYADQVRRVLDAVEATGLARRFILVGLCSGGYHAFRTALSDSRILAAHLINPAVLVWRPRIFAEREARKVNRVADVKWVGKLLRGEIEARKLRHMTASVAGQAWARVRSARGEGTSWPAELESDLDQLEANGTQLTLLFSYGEEMARELDAAGFAAKLGRRPLVEMVQLPGSDHTLRPLDGQAALRDALDERIGRMLMAEGWWRGPVASRLAHRVGVGGG